MLEKFRGFVGGRGEDTPHPNGTAAPDPPRPRLDYWNEQGPRIDGVPASASFPGSGNSRVNLRIDEPLCARLLALNIRRLPFIRIIQQSAQHGPSLRVGKHGSGRLGCDHLVLLDDLPLHWQSDRPA
jgi:hypothetical protein